MDKARTIKFRRLAAAVSLVFSTVGLVAFAPTNCSGVDQATDFDGTVRQAMVARSAATPVSDKTMTVYFDANVASGLPWDFWPETPKVVTRVGVPTKVFYYVRNNSHETLVAKAVFTVTPYRAAPNFFMIECFCFAEERLGPGESARMPVVIYIHDRFLKDPNTREVHEIMLSYTFFRQNDFAPVQAGATRRPGERPEDLDSRPERVEAVNLMKNWSRR